MKKTHDDYIRIGKIGSTYGVHGWLKVYAYTEIGTDIINYMPWYLSYNQPQEWRCLPIEKTELQVKHILVKFSGINTPEEARLLTGKHIAIPRSQLPALNANEYYWADLIGLTVINKTGEIYGKVTYLIETGSNDVLIVKGEKEHAIPYLWGDVILSIDLDKKEIHVDWELI
jgi:16S rRNA processing protein RimM